MTKQKVAIYGRVSTQEQAVEGVSIESQIAALKAYAESQGWEIADQYIDGGYSGGTDDRPALKRLLSDAGQGKFQIIAVCKLDRFFRNLRLLLNHLHSLEQLGIKFVATQEGLDTSNAYGKFAVQIMGVIAEFERGRIGERVRDSLRYRIAQGHWPGGQTLYGYRWLYDENKWEIDDTEAGMVRYIYDLYLKEGLGTMRIPFRLNEEGHHTRRGHRWGFNVVYNILSNPAYKGDHPKGYKMPAIIDEETWEKAQKKRREARHVRKRVHNWLLQGRCICGECGHAMSCQQKDRNERRYYGCLGRFKDTHLDGSPACKLPRMKADLLERAVWERLKEVLSDSETLKEGMRNSLNELMGRRKQLYQSTGSVDEKLEAIVAKKERLGLTFADGAISRETYQKKLQEAIKIEKDLLRSRDNLNPDDRSEIGDLDRAIASLEETINSSSVKILLTELGVQVLHIPEDWIVGHDSPVEGAGLENWNVVGAPGTLKIPELGMTMNVVDGPELNSNFEVTRETIWRNIRDIFNRLNIKVYVFKDRVEIRGNIPTEIIDIPQETNRLKGGPIICSGRGLGG